MATADRATRPQSRPRTPALVQLASTVAITILLAAVTLTTRQPPPPAIAEFAPEAAEQIKEQPKEQSSEFGSGAGAGDCPPGAQCDAGDGSGAGGGGTATTTAPAAVTTAPPPVARASVKRCVGDPPRQIEDPQSPPCVAYWDDSKGNGGATAPGVTKDTVTIATPDDPQGLYDGLVRFFNSRFQFYGRKIVIAKTGAGGTAGADAAKEAGAFASASKFNDIPYFRQLAKHKIIGTYRTPEFSDTELAGYAPYIWGYPMSYTQMASNLADWACRRLVRLPAKHAGELDGRSMATTERSFAIFFDAGRPDTTASPEVLKSGLQQCGAKVPFVTTYPRADTSPVRMRTDMSQAKAAGATTVFCLCLSTNLVHLQVAAESNLYQPEWIISGYPQLVQGDVWANGPQADRIFGVSFEPRDTAPEDHPQIWAMREADPSHPYANDRSTLLNSNDIHYRGLLLLASGIQMAGPNLTPETFRQGLQKTRFPNPDHPIRAGSVGFEGDFSMTNDGAEFWLSTKDPSPYSDRRGFTFCWVDGGRRHSKGNWPRGVGPFFSGPCDSGVRSVS